ncbi:SubName: Full=Uncharacterized protein {ECO:0000313/EMBL:CCA71169.1} [Serendipita indica DSM 11827]|nr:SubName: Full=Uncharacterized protein {ECO:0000313/EMBL:CCA71169.1} [Serendipita indica DSM 11827]
MLSAVASSLSSQLEFLPSPRIAARALGQARWSDYPSYSLAPSSSRDLTYFEYQRNSTDLDVAINIPRWHRLENGIQHPGAPARYALALTLLRRFEQNGGLKDLEGALKNAQLAYDAVSKREQGEIEWFHRACRGHSRSDAS